MKGAGRSSLLLAALLCAALPAGAQAAPERDLTPEEVEAWLDSRALPSSDQESSGDAEVPPPPPRHRGLVVESAVGALGHTGPMKNVSPTAPWFLLRVGYEPLRWLMLFAESDVSFASTAYASPPPPPRSYWLYGFGAGVRFTASLGDRFGAFVQGSVGGARVSEENVLSIYGYENADELSAYLGALLGVEWYQASPHLALGLHAGVRNYSGLERQASSAAPAAWVGALALRYAF